MPSLNARAMVEDSTVSLNQASVGCPLRVARLEGPACRELREIGFCEEMRVELLGEHRRLLLCRLCGARLALSRDLAEQVKVCEVSAV